MGGGGIREYSKYICQTITQAVDFIFTRNPHRLQSCVSLSWGLAPPRCLVFGLQTTSETVKGLSLQPLPSILVVTQQLKLISYNSNVKLNSSILASYFYPWFISQSFFKNSHSISRRSSVNHFYMQRQFWAYRKVSPCSHACQQPQILDSTRCKHTGHWSLQGERTSMYFLISLYLYFS